MSTDERALDDGALRAQIQRDDQAKTMPPLGDYGHTQRLCTRHGPAGEVLCGEPGVRHVIWWWREAKEGENPDDCWDHGFACEDHWTELHERWSFAAAHALMAACGMPGSHCSLTENACTFEGLDVDEPDRCVSVSKCLPTPLDNAYPPRHTKCMSTTQPQSLTDTQRREILAAEYRAVLANMTPSMGTRFSGSQISAAKGIARRRALAIIDAA